MSADNVENRPAEPTRPPHGRLRHRDVAAIAVPITLSNATVPLVGYVDTVVIGQQVGGPHLIGGVALAAVMFNNIYWIFGFLRMGTTGLTAQAAGAANQSEVTANLLRALAVAAIAGGVLIAIQMLLLALFLWLMGGSPAVNGAVQAYFEVRIWGAPAALANFVLVGWFIGLGRANVAFVLQLILNGVNIVCALVFVLAWQWGVFGVGLAALLSDLVATAFGLWFAWRELSRRGAVIRDADLANRAALGKMFTVNRDVILRTACLIFAFSFFASQGARAGDLALAANAVLLSIALLFVYMLDGFAFAAETLVGQAIGANRRDRYRDAIRFSAIWGVGLAVVFTGVLLLAGNAMIDITAKDPAVQSAAREYVHWAALIPIVGIWCYLLDGIFVGATGTAQMRNTAFASLAVYLAVWSALAPAYGNDGLWLSILIFLAARAVTLGLYLPGLERRVFAPGN